MRNTKLLSVRQQESSKLRENLSTEKLKGVDVKFEWIRDIDSELEASIWRTFSHQILNLYRIDDSYLVLFVWDHMNDDEAVARNAWKLDSSFNLIWKVEKYDFRDGQVYPYTGASLVDGILRIRSYEGIVLRLDYETGQVTRLPGSQRAY